MIPPDPAAIHLSTLRSRLVGYGVYIYITRGVMIDTAFHAARRSVARLIDVHRPIGVLITHHHEDHAGNIELVRARGIPIAAPAATLDLARAPAAIGFYRRFVWSSMPPLRGPVTPFDHPGLELMPAPGHSADHHVVWDAERATLFAADLYLSVKVRLARPGEDPRVLARSLRSIARLAPARMFDAHRGEVRDPVAALLAKADWLDATIGEIDRRLDAGLPDHAIVEAVFGGEARVRYLSNGDLSRLNFVRAVRQTPRAG